jgi:hypothetical protein
VVEVGAKRPADGGLSNEQVELLTDLMVNKLAMSRIIYSPERRDADKLLRDEVMLVIVDTEILLRSGNVDETLEMWARK